MSAMSATGEHGTSVDRVHAALREKVLDGTYPPGSRLILSRLAGEHEVSFIPVREALQRLEAERMVRTERNRGATVTEISVADMRDIYETRLVLEDHAIRAAVPRLTAADIRAAAGALKDMRAGFRARDEAAAYAAHERFHFSLYDAADSAWTVHLVRQLWAGAERYVRLGASVRPGPKAFIAEHAEILSAVKAGDADAAAGALADNLRTTERLLAEAYEGG
jgi:DNA-binding GntR family transcriptional regulator